MKSRAWFSRRSPRSARPVALRLEKLEDRRVPALTYHGGPLLANVGVETLFIGSAWQNNASLHQQALQLDQFFQDITNGPYLDQLGEYSTPGQHVGRGKFLDGSVLMASLPPGSLVFDSDIEGALDSLIQNGSLQAPDGNRLYVVFTPPGVVVSTGFGDSQTTFLGYHSAFIDSSGDPVYYAVLPNPVGNSTVPGLTAFQQLTAVGSHELAEAITDPDGRSGWYDTSVRPAEEIGDLTEQNLGTLQGYTLQQEFSNRQFAVTGNGAFLLQTSIYSGTAAAAPAGASASLTVAHIADRDPYASPTDYTATINWGDGQSSAGSVVASPAGGWDVRGVHAFGSAGTYTAQVSVQEGAGPAVVVTSTVAVTSPDLPTIAGVGSGADRFVYAVTPDHSLFQLDAAGNATRLGNAGTIASVAATAEASGNPVVFAVTTNGALYRFDWQAGWTPLGAPGTIIRVTAGTDVSGRAEVYALTTGGAFAEYRTGLGWLKLGDPGTILAAAAAGSGRAYVVTADQSVAGFDDRVGWSRLSGRGFAQSVSAGTDAAGNPVVFAVGADDSLRRFTPQTGWVTAAAAGMVQSVGVGTDAAGQADAFALGTDNVPYLYTVSTGHVAVGGAATVQELAAGPGGQAFVVTAGGAVAVYTPTGWLDLTGPGFALG